jgi:ectoine hydroxylase-related dioxygenase (phytanoyl-CoA dioxygenase family)
MKATFSKQVAFGLLEQARFTEDEMRGRLNQALNAEYWEGLNPMLTVGDQMGSVAETSLIDERSQDSLFERLASDGYFQTEAVLPASVITAMKECVEALKQERWPAVFAFVYDEFWQVVRNRALVQLLSRVLGPGYKQNSHIWCFYVPARDGASGWPPHMDNFTLGNRVTIWIPLTDATVENGCIYVIPQQRIPEHLINVNFKRFNPVTGADLSALLQGTRALPARAGSLLGWNSQLIHWGSRNGGSDQPRISLSVEFVGESSEATPDEHPLFEGHATLPTFPERLQVIGQCMLAYRRFEPSLLRYHDLAKHLTALHGDPIPLPISSLLGG